ncbi:MAG: hypothetical protein HC831_23050, partial [Chloroflexia bacterium]|nr:hypothetical protein [Chloroflexia bacterium]
MYNFNSSTSKTKSTIKAFIEGIGESELDCEIQDGKYIYQGDIVITDYDDNITKGLIIPYISSRWKSNTVPYVITNGMNNNEIIRAMNHIESKSNIQFVKRTSQRNYIEFVKANGCWSYVGMQGGKQQIGLSPLCGYGATVHEICHALGIWHEQSRSDRDNYVTINWSNIQQDAKHNFNKHISDGTNIGKYDYSSIMHYSKYAFAINSSKPTIIPKYSSYIGQRNGLSNGDIYAIKRMYGYSRSNDEYPSSSIIQESDSLE